MEISEKLKERFCKDCNIPIKLFMEPFFTNRLIALNPFYNSYAKYLTFIEEYKKAGYKNEQEYFEEYNKIKDNAMDFIKNNKAYQEFNSCDMSKFSINAKLPSNDIYKPSNDGRKFISIDMKKANFSSLYHYNPAIFDNCSSWEEFISKFTNNQHIKNSKYIRQVILGNCNPKRHITYEKYLTYKLLEYLMAIFDIKVEYFSNDEIVLEYTNNDIENKVADFIKANNIEFRVTRFTLYKIENTDGYYKEIETDNNPIYEFKSLDSFSLPLVVRAAVGEEPCDLDNYFIAEGRLAKFIEPIKINIPKLI